MTFFSTGAQTTTIAEKNSLDKHRKVLVRAVFVILIFLFALFISRNFFQLMLIQGKSMEPTLHDLQFVIIDKTAKNKGFIPGDIIAFESIKPDMVIVKRIAATPGQTVQMIDKTLYVNGIPSELYDAGIFEYAGLLENELKLGEDEYIVIGDNIQESKDSRYDEIGIVKGSSIIGKIR